jgi:hypothetical protein
VVAKVALKLAPTTQQVVNVKKPAKVSESEEESEEEEKPVKKIKSPLVKAKSPLQKPVVVKKKAVESSE